MPLLALALGCYLNVFVPRASQLARRATLLVLLLSLGVLALAGFKQMLDPGPALLLEALALVALGWFAARRVSWSVCVAVTFAALAIGVFYLQPAYNRQFALRDQLPSEAALAARGAPVVCYPLRWDSVSFYLPHADVRVYTREQRHQLLADLRSRPRTLLLVKSGKVFEEFLRDLPDSVDFMTHSRAGIVTAGWVRSRPEPSADSYARR
jgi:hypothetical protein